MNDRVRLKDAEVVPDALTTRVLKRASELDALRRAGATVAELRAAAAEAGISAEAFDAALAEVREAEATPAVATRSRTGLKAIAASVALVIGLGLAFVTTRMDAPAAPPGTIEQTLSARCLTPAQVGELARPLIDPRTSSLSFNDRTPGEFTIRATPADIEKVKSALDAPGTCARQ